MKKMNYLFIVLGFIIFSCNNSTQPSTEQVKTSEQEAMSFARVIPPSGNTTIVSYSADGKDTLFTYVTNHDTTVYVPFTYPIQRTDTVWHLQGQTPSNLAPIVNAGQSQTITLPTNSINLSGSASDPDGTIASTQWSKVSGNGGSITDASNLNTTVTGLSAGSYMFSLTATDNKGLQSSSNVNVVVNSEVVVSSGIQGFGADAVGGSQSSTVYHVTNLSASGAGSLANGIGSNKTIVFDVSGTINARLYASNVSYLTIDAYSSKQDITVATTQGDALTVENSHHIIIRGIRFKHVGTDGNDALNATGNSHDVAFDHCTGAGAFDGNIDLAATSGKNFTVQWCLMYSNRGSGNMLVTTQNASVHHNLFIGNGSGEGAERNPYAHSKYSTVDVAPNLDLVNNLMYASGRYVSGNGYNSAANYINNYYTSNKPGLINLCADPTGCSSPYTAKAYVSGNYNQTSATGGTIVSTPYSIPAKYQVVTTDAKTAGRAVKESAGTYQRNQEEQNLISAITIAQ